MKKIYEEPTLQTAELNFSNPVSTIMSDLYEDASNLEK